MSRKSKNTEEKRAQLNVDYIVMKKMELYVLDKNENRQRIRVEYPIGLTEDDIEDIMTDQTDDYLRLDGNAPGYIPLITITQRQK